MRSNRTKGLLAQMLVVVSLLFGFVAFAGTTAEAQYRSRGRIVCAPESLSIHELSIPERIILGRTFTTECIFRRPLT